MVRYRARIRMTTTRARRISTRTATGRTFPTTVRRGSRTSRRAGLLTARAIGFGSLTGDGPGFRMSLGAGRRITTVAGSNTTERGAGIRDRFIRTIVRCGRRLTSRSLDSAAGLALASVGDRLAGSRLARVISSTPGGADGAGALVIRIGVAGTAAGLLRC